MSLQSNESGHRKSSVEKFINHHSDSDEDDDQYPQIVGSMGDNETEEGSEVYDYQVLGGLMNTNNPAMFNYTNRFLMKRSFIDEDTDNQNPSEMEDDNQI